MYLANTIENNARCSYYGVNSVPWTVVDGNVFSNNGNNTITSFDLNFEVNDGTMMTENWTGSIGPLEKVVVSLPAYTFVPQANNSLTVFTDNPNNNSDEYPKNDTLNFPIMEAPAATFTLFLFLKTDNAPEETTWDVKDAQGTEVVQGGQFGYYEKTEFNANIVSAHERFDQTKALQVYPNPVSAITTASFYLVNPDNVSLNLYNIFGQQVWNHQPGYLGAGEHQVKIDAGNLTPGVYILQMATGNKIYTRKITVNR